MNNPQPRHLSPGDKWRWWAGGRRVGKYETLAQHSQSRSGNDLCCFKENVFTQRRDIHPIIPEWLLWCGALTSPGKMVFPGRTQTGHSGLVMILSSPESSYCWGLSSKLDLCKGFLVGCFCFQGMVCCCSDTVMHASGLKAARKQGKIKILGATADFQTNCRNTEKSRVEKV